MTHFWQSDLFFSFEKKLREKKLKERKIVNCVTSSSFLLDISKSGPLCTNSHPFLFSREIISKYFNFFRKNVKNGTKRRCNKRSRKGQANREGGFGEVEREWCRIGFWIAYEKKNRIFDSCLGPKIFPQSNLS